MDHAQELQTRHMVNHNPNKSTLQGLHDPAPPSPNSSLSSPTATTVLELSTSPEPGQVQTHAAATQKATAPNAAQKVAAEASTLVADGGRDSVYGSYGPGLGFLQPLAPPGESEGPEAAQEYEQYTKRWKAGTTLAQRWDRVQARGGLATIQAEWEDLSLDITLQERCWHTPQAAAARAAAAAARAAEGVELNKSAPRGSRRRPELDADVCLSPTGEGRKMRCRNAPRMLQDFQVDLPHNKKSSSSEPDSATDATPPASPAHTTWAAAATDENIGERAVARRAPDKQHQQQIHQAHAQKQAQRIQQHQQKVQAQARVQGTHASRPEAAAGGSTGAQGPAAASAVQPQPMPMPAHRHVGAAAEAAPASAPGGPGADAAMTEAVALLRMFRAVGLDAHQLQEALQLMHQLSAAFGDSRPEVFQEFQRQSMHFAQDPATFMGYMRAVVHTLANAQQQLEQQQQHFYLQQQLQQHQLEQQMQHKRARQQ